MAADNMASVARVSLLWLGLAASGGALLLWWSPWPGAITQGLCLLLVIATLWLSEALPLAVTGLLVPLLATVLGIFSLSDALAKFADPIIFLFLGGFALAAALHQQQLDSWLAGRIVAIAQGRLWLAALLLLATTALISMWISNTATAAMMLPLTLGLCRQLPGDEHHTTRTFLLLGMAYSASVGGMGTLIGSPPNAIAASWLGWGFVDWLVIGLPLVMLMWPLTIAVLYLTLRPNLRLTIACVEQQGFVWHGQRQLTLLIFTLSVSLWLLARPLGQWLGHAGEIDTLVALLAIIAVVSCRVASWPAIERQTEWGVLLLFGGGLTLGAALHSSGASTFIASTLAETLAGAPLWLVLFLFTAVAVYLSELVSNTALAALLVPLLAPLAAPLGVPPAVLVIVVAMAASCSFMLPVGTPPNALVFATGEISQRQMIRSGIWLDLACILALAGGAWLVTLWL